MRKLLLSGLAVLLSTTFAAAGGPARSYTDAHALVAALQEQLKSVADYSMTVFAQDSHHEWVFDYRCVRPSNIRAEILEGSHRGTVVVFVPAIKDKMVKVKAGNKRVWRSIDRLKLRGTPVVESVIDKFANDLNDFTFTMKAHQTVVLDVGRPVQDKPDSNDDPALSDPDLQASPAPSAAPAVSAQRVEKDCYVLDGVKGDVREEMTFDRATLWPVSIKVWNNGKVQQSAEIWHMAVNTSPKIDF